MRQRSEDSTTGSSRSWRSASLMVLQSAPAPTSLNNSLTQKEAVPNILSGERRELPERRRHRRLAVVQPVHGGDAHLWDTHAYV